MCRFLCYMGPEVLLADFLYRPKNSLILQSYKSRERKEPLNGDGFGVGWYLRKRWTDILLLQRPLSAKIYLRARQREAWEIGK